MFGISGLYKFGQATLPDSFKSNLMLAFMEYYLGYWNCGYRASIVLSHEQWEMRICKFRDVGYYHDRRTVNLGNLTLRIFCIFDNGSSYLDRVVVVTVYINANIIMFGNTLFGSRRRILAPGCARGYRTIEILFVNKNLWEHDYKHINMKVE